MRVWLAFLLMLSMLSAARAEDMQELVSRGSLVVEMLESDLPPFIFKNEEGKLTGYDVEIAKGVAAELKLKLVIERKAKTFNELVDAVAEGRADMALSKLSRTLQRSKKVVFSNPYLTLHKTLILNRLQLAKRRKSLALPDYVKRLDGTLAVIDGSSYEEFAKVMFPKAKLKTFTDWASVVAEVSAGRVLGGFRDDLEVKRSMRSLPDASLRLLSVVLVDSEDDIAIAVGAHQLQFRLWLNEFLEERKLVTSVDKLLERYPAAAFNQAGAGGTISR